MIPLYLINLPRSTDRLKAFTDSTPDFASIKLTKAVDGMVPSDTRPYARLIPETQSNTALIKPGVFGCFCSHVKVWNSILENDDPFALVMEDDAKVKGSEESFQLLLSEMASKNLDILFTNRKSSLWLAKTHIKTLTVSVDEAVKSFAPYNSLPRNPSSIGTDGYIITRHGAQKMLEQAEKFRARLDVDVFLVQLSVKFEENLISWPHFKRGRKLGVCCDKPVLNAHISGKPLTTNIGGQLGRTTIHNEEKVNWSDLK